MTQIPSFIVIDYHAESRFLLVKTLHRKFPDAIVHESEDARKAIEMVRTGNLAAIITHRTFETTGIELVKRLREVDPLVPIIMVSGIDREEEAHAAGADAFLQYDQWLRIGSVVEAHLRKEAAAGESATEIA